MLFDQEPLKLSYCTEVITDKKFICEAVIVSGVSAIESAIGCSLLYLAESLAFCLTAERRVSHNQIKSNRSVERSKKAINILKISIQIRKKFLKYKGKRARSP